MSDFTERRSRRRNRRGNGWRWYARRADRRQRNLEVRPGQRARTIAGRFGGRRIHHRRAEDRDVD